MEKGVKWGAVARAFEESYEIEIRGDPKNLVNTWKAEMCFLTSGLIKTAVAE